VWGRPIAPSPPAGGSARREGRMATGGVGGGRRPPFLFVSARRPAGFFGWDENKVKIVRGSNGWNEPQGILVSHKQS